LSIKEHAGNLLVSELWSVLIDATKEDIYYSWQCAETTVLREQLHARLEGIIIIAQRLEQLAYAGNESDGDEYEH
jgi:hypothetical protein